MTETLPDGWRWAKVGELCERIDYGYTASADFTIDEPRFLRITDIQNGSVDWRRVPGCTITAKEEAANLLAEGDIVFARTGGTTGKSFLIQSPPRAVFASYLIRLRASHQTIAEFLYLFFQSDEYWQQIRKSARGGAQPNVNATLLADITLPLPPLDEQKRIASRLNEQMQAVAEARTAAQAQLDATNALPAAYLRDVFDSAEKCDKPDWKKTRLGNVLSLRKEVIHPRNNPEGKAVFVGLEHIKSGTGERIGQIHVDMSSLTGRKPRFYKGDIVYGYLRPYLNKLWIAEFDGLCSVDQYVYSVRQEIADTQFIAWFMLSPTYLNRAPIDTTPGQLPRIRTEEVATVALTLPPVEEQKRIVSRLDAQMQAVAEARNAAAAQLAALDALPAALLREAFAGRV